MPRGSQSARCRFSSWFFERKVFSSVGSMKGGSGIDYGSQHGNQLVSAKLLQYGNGKGVPWDLSPVGASRTVSARLLCSLHRQQRSRTSSHASAHGFASKRSLVEPRLRPSYLTHAGTTMWSRSRGVRQRVRTEMGCVLAIEHTVWGGSARCDEGMRRVLEQDIARCRLRDCKEYAHKRRQIRENQCDGY